MKLGLTQPQPASTPLVWACRLAMMALCGGALTACETPPGDPAPQFTQSTNYTGEAPPYPPVSGPAPGPMATPTTEAPVVTKAPAPAPAPVATLVPEEVLMQGVKSYMAGQYPAAEAQLKIALKLGLSTRADVVSANKYLAFIYCTSQRESLCAAAFKAARAADSNFMLTKAEAGHPMWAGTYKKVLSIK